jgi:hemoglobin
MPSLSADPTASPAPSGSSTSSTRERFVAAYLEALDEAGLPADAPFRQAVREHVEFGSHVAQQNSWAETDADLHPIRAVPTWNWPDAPQ